MKLKVEQLQKGDIVADVPVGSGGYKFNAKVTEIHQVYDLDFKPVRAVIVKVFIIREDGTPFHTELKLPDGSEWEVLYRDYEGSAEFPKPEE